MRNNISLITPLSSLTALLMTACGTVKKGRHPARHDNHRQHNNSHYR